MSDKKMTKTDLETIRITLDFAVQDRRWFIDAYDGEDNEYTKVAAAQIKKFQILHRKLFQNEAQP